MSTPNDIQALLASIRPRPSPSSTPAQDPGMAPYPPQYQQGYRTQQPPPYDGQSYPHAHLQQQQHGYRHPSVSSVIQTPLPVNTPRHGSDILSPNIPTPRDAFPPPQHHQPLPQNPDRAVNLLNLLKFNQPAAPPAQQQAPVVGMEQSSYTPPVAPGVDEATKSHTRNISASDLVASLFGRQGQAPLAPVQPTGVQPLPQSAAESPSATPGAEKPQEMLLRLLNRSKSGQEMSGSPAKSSIESPGSIASQKNVFFEPEVASNLSVEEATERLSGASDKLSPTGKESLFIHVNPFDQLAALSRNRTPQPKSRSESPVVEATRSQFTANFEAAPASQILEGERAKSPSLAEEQKEAVSNVVDRLVEQLVRDVDESLEKLTQEKRASVQAAQEDSTQAILSSISVPLEEIPNGENQNDVLKETPEEFVSSAVPKESSNNSSGEALAESWESAEESAEKDEERIVSVHNFPLRPFISITVKSFPGKISTLRDDGIMDIARLKKDFDQLDRSLTSATPDYIVYALAKNGGMRIIRQDDGSDKQVFRSTRDRVFNVAVCTSQSMGGSSDEQAVLGIGVSGAVYWALISRGDRDLFEQDALESECLIFPPFPASDENTSGGQLKTRAKRSSRHPGFFAIGRGKNIYVISPQAAANPAYGVSGSNRTVNTEKFFKERAMKISTGKAGKDFMFSDDDTVIASLDKTGRLRFWDIREVVNSSSFFTSGPNPAEVRIPLNTFVTGSPTEKSWPTSVLFIDKLRPYIKSMALRYVLVGLKQNHTLQLWDIGLGKAVQELKFPHENESDAICSVAYHPGSGIIVVGHPTRNSIYFVHLSAPRYNLQPMSQASFIKRAGEKDNSLPKPESTACMSGIREISFASKGQLRSLDLLPITKAAGDESGLFELYVMHSRGVTCLNIRKEDLGWSQDNKIIRPVNALEEGLIDISDLQAFPTYISDEPSVNGDANSTPTKMAPKEVTRNIPELSAEPSASAGPSTLRTQSPVKTAIKKKLGDEQSDAATAAAASEKPEKKKKKKGTAVTGEPAKAKEVSPATNAGDDHSIDQTNGDTFKSPTVSYNSVPPPALYQSVAASGSGESYETLNKHLEAFQIGVAGEFQKSLGRELEGLLTRFDEERRSWDAASTARQDQVLRLVSSTLSDNVEKNLARIVTQGIQSEVVPALSSITSTAVGKELNTVLPQQLGEAVSRELRQSLPGAVDRALQQPGTVKVLSDAVGQKLTSHVETEISKAMQNTVTPAFKSLALHTAEKVGSDMEKQMQAQMRQFEIQRKNDAAKIEQLTSLVRGLSDTVTAMAAAQTGFQNEVLRLNQVLASRQAEGSQGLARSAAASSTSPAPAPAPPANRRSPEQLEMAEISQLMGEGRYEEASVKWLQSEQQADLFDNLFVRMNPSSYLPGLSPIVALSVGVAVTSSLDSRPTERLAWLDVVLQTVNLMDPDIREVAPKIMDILIQRLDALYMSVAAHSPHDPILRRVPPLARRARELRG
ncbi:hypothetical protein P175DRAFT_0501482 [Aspergillus ochraceoroseus IBT 24754]|uniref:EDC4-like protein pdc1 beta-propeller domain-containing protein n=2 Tax=Aspergillus ochraceoroseus TaxID=138278 RepID=A0A2T5LX25_9EURO|nr:uncharacterized protein P175DRAFT_0501482 [Aspergillus ochraceoroseus IBT 24754]KKK12448.1 hypothetical protein AOCH_000430 [Aspergillus ochraceoroseus]PTU20845.1 hypothetical protein P175DRAFT_0501482 [Aspergillus ochraceoroseus IBT 24754]